MDIEKLIRRLRNDADAYRNGETLGRAFADQEDVLDNASTALSTLQAENEKLRAELEQVKAELNTAKSPEVLEAVDELMEFARTRMSTADWLYYVDVLGEWRGPKED